MRVSPVQVCGLVGYVNRPVGRLCLSLAVLSLDGGVQIGLANRHLSLDFAGFAEVVIRKEFQ